mgnify:CR=1 FL=1|tara:strand:+ start:37 stop:462 length:426 start_codon:yes stop_codon:yes gene_type:complete
MKRLLPLLLLISSPAYSVPVVPNFSQGSMTSTTRTVSTVVESIVSHDYNTGHQYSINGSNLTIDGSTISPNSTTITGTVDGQTQSWTGLDLTTRPSVTITNGGQAFQYVETYQGPGLSNITTINRTTNIESTTETTSVFSQ